jgi:hypothetical protein
MIASESVPSARIAARSITVPPEAVGRDRRLTIARIGSSEAGAAAGAEGAVIETQRSGHFPIRVSDSVSCHERVRDAA